MDTTNKLMFDLADAEFGAGGELNPSFNSPSLMGTLESLTPAAAASTATYEGYSAWSVAHHVAYDKWVVISSLAGESVAGPYPFEVGEYGFSAPAMPDADAWGKTLAYLRRIHGIQMDVLRSLPQARFDEIMPDWNAPYGRIIAWLCSHDSYHTAQILSMGVPGLKEEGK